MALAASALTYPTTARGEAANLAVHDGIVYATLAEDGVAIIRVSDGARLATLPPAEGSGSADDLAIADGFLFVLDAREPGALSVYSLDRPLSPRIVSPPLRVPVEPFSGVSAANGVVVVSGGTSELTAWRYGRSGVLSGPFATADFGRGQPDVLLSVHRPLAFVPTHFQGPRFGLDIAAVDARGITLLASLPLPGAGFTAGGAKPASFPIDVAELSRDTVLVAHHAGVAVIDVSDPSQPRLLETIDAGGPAVNVDARDGAAVVLVGTLPGAVALAGGKALVAAGSRGVLCFDRSTTTQREDVMQRSAWMRVAAVAAVAVSLSACTKAEGEMGSAQEAGTMPMAADSATYTIVFKSTWTPATHAFEYPPAGAISGPHFSGLIGATHNAGYRLFADGAVPTPGLERLSEEGRHSPLDEEIRAAVTAGTAGMLFETGGLRDFGDSLVATVRADRAHALLSLAAMIAPSPDWFTGLHDVPLMENGAWVASRTLTLHAWDSGGDDGTTYRAADRDTNPKKPTMQAATRHFVVNGAAVPVATVTITRM